MDPRIIKTEADYKRALKEAERLIDLDPTPDTEEGERLALLSLLIEKYESEVFPIELPDPIEAIKFRMEEQGLKQRDLIPFIGSKSKVSEVLAGKRPLTISMIRALHEGLGIPPEVLISGTKEEEDCENIDPEKFPLNEIAKRGWLEPFKSNAEEARESSFMRFMEQVGDPAQIAAFCRRSHLISRSGKSMDRYYLLAWATRIVIVARSSQLVDYKEGVIDDEFISRVAKLSTEGKGPRRAKEYLAEHGIPLIIESHLPKTHLDGMVMLLDNTRPVIGLTIRHDRLDNFWFTLIHELTHAWKHLRSQGEAFVFVDDLDSDPGEDWREREADFLAQEILIPRNIWQRSDAYRQRTSEAVRELAFRLKIHPAIVAGRIRYDTNNFHILSHMVGSGEVRRLFPEVCWSWR